MRNEEEVLARARVANLVGVLAGGTSVELVRPELQRHGLGIYLTEQEAAWFWEDAVPDERERAQLEAMLALGWALHLVPSLVPGGVEAYAVVQDALDDTSLAPGLREEREIRAKLDEIERAHASTPSEALARRRDALRWLLGDDEGA